MIEALGFHRRPSSRFANDSCGLTAEGRLDRVDPTKPKRMIPLNFARGNSARPFKTVRQKTNKTCQRCPGVAFSFVVWL
jgi:hypothetical protein